MTENVQPRDYSRYDYTLAEKIVLGGKIGVVVAGFCYFFYRSVFAVAALWPLALFMRKRDEKRKIRQEQRELNAEFVECIMAVSVTMQAGYSVENAFLESRKDMETYYGADSCIYQELEGIRRGLVLNIPLEEQLFGLGERSKVEDIGQFAEIFAIAKKRGGDMPRIISRTVERIRQRMQVQEEIGVLLSGKEMEQMVMRIMPFGILLYIGVTYPGYFDPLYHNIAGIAIMSVALLIYAAAFLLGEHVLSKIEEEMTNASETKKEKDIPKYETGILCRLAQQLRKVLPRFQNKAVCKNLECLYPERNKQEIVEEYGIHKSIMTLVLFFAVSFLATILYWKEWSGGGIGGYAACLAGCAAFAGGIFFLMDKDLADKAQKNKQRRRMQYPDIVHKLVLYMGAGLSVRGCFNLLGSQYDAILFACRDFQAGMTEPVVFERFGRRLGIQEYIRLGMLLGQNAKRGNATLLSRLEEEAFEVSKSRQQEARILGEKAQTKLLVPMVLMLLVVMVFIMVPAFFSF